MKAMMILPRALLITATTGTVLIPKVVLAHLGHLGDLAGHSHWIGLAGLAVAGAMLWGVLKDGKQTPDEDADSVTDSTDDAEDSEVPA
jgi:hypothetical protein